MFKLYHILLFTVYSLKYIAFFPQLHYQSLSMYIDIIIGEIGSIAMGIRKMVLLPPSD